MPIKDLPIFGQYNVQQFLQFVPEDIANWNLVKNPKSKKGFAFYPAFGRKHITQQDQNILVFVAEPRAEYESANYYYVFVEDKVFRYDANFNRIQIIPPDMSTTAGPIYFTYLVAPSYTLAVWTDTVSMWVHNENTDSTVRITDPSLIANPSALAAFGNRIVVTGKNTSEFRLSKINLGPLVGLNVDPATAFGGVGGAIFAFETEDIVNFGVLHNTLYVFLGTTTSVWSNIPSVFPQSDGTIVQFPWKKNTTYNFDYGLASAFTLSIGFGRMVWLGNNADGLNQILVSYGDQPKPISTEAIDILLERDAILNQISPFVLPDSIGFLYQYQNKVYYRMSAGRFFNHGILDMDAKASSIEYNFDTTMWKRCIEANGERNRIKNHVYFSNRHLVSMIGDTTIYEMSGQFFTNDIRNSAQADPQAADAYIAQPFRYERVSQIISEPDYGEFLTEWVQIDFVWGDKTFINSGAPFENAVYIIDENGEFLITEDGEYIVAEEGNYPVFNSSTYRNWFKPHIELYFSDDGGINYRTANVREFSQLGVYQWRMRWYELGPSRDRVYKLIAVSPSPIVILGAIMDVRRASGNAA